MKGEDTRKEGGRRRMSKRQASAYISYPKPTLLGFAGFIKCCIPDLSLATALRSVKHSGLIIS